MCINSEELLPPNKGAPAFQTPRLGRDAPSPAFAGRLGGGSPPEIMHMHQTPRPQSKRGRTNDKHTGVCEIIVAGDLVKSSYVHLGPKSKLKIYYPPDPGRNRPTSMISLMK
jgi:hypothetical protein